MRPYPKNLSFMLDSELSAVHEQLSKLNEWGGAAAAAGLSAGKLLTEGGGQRNLKIASIRLGPLSNSVLEK